MSRACALTLAFAALVVACGGRASSERERVEHALAQQSKGVCDGNCRTFHASDATCVRVGGAQHLYRCRVRYDNGGGTERVCAAANRTTVNARPLRECVP